MSATLKSEQPFLPAAGHDLFLPLYDPLTRLLGLDRVRRTLLEQAELKPNDRVLDVGCGTGTLAALIKRTHPGVEVVALDPDPRALVRASRKAERAGVSVRFDRGFADALAYPDATFDRVFSSMMFHHLESDQKERALREMRRVLKPGGRLELLDFARPGRHGQSVLGRLLHRHRQLRDNTDDRILEQMARAGFAPARKVRTLGMLFGPLGFFQGSVPE